MFSDRGRLPPFIAYALAGVGTKSGFRTARPTHRRHSRDGSLPTTTPPAAAEEALADASWRPVGDDERLRTGVAIGSGMGHLPDIIKAGQLVHSGPFPSARRLRHLCAPAHTAPVLWLSRTPPHARRRLWSRRQGEESEPVFHPKHPHQPRRRPRQHAARPRRPQPRRVDRVRQRCAARCADSLPRVLR